MPGWHLPRPMPAALRGEAALDGGGASVGTIHVGHGKIL